jgi:hypothetical protein
VAFVSSQGAAYCLVMSYWVSIFLGQHAASYKGSHPISFDMCTTHCKLYSNHLYIFYLLKKKTDYRTKGQVPPHTKSLRHVVIHDPCKTNPIKATESDLVYILYSPFSFTPPWVFPANARSWCKTHRDAFRIHPCVATFAP